MIEIEYFGGNAVKITNNKQSLIINPKRSQLGLKDIDVENTTKMATSVDLLKEEGRGLTIDCQGEYEVNGYTITAIAANGYQDMGRNLFAETMFSIVVEDIRIAILGNIEPKLNDDQLESIGMADILVLPVGGGGVTLYGKEAAVIVKQISPKIVVPTHYADGSVNYEVPQDSEAEFIAALEAEVEQKDRLVIKKTTDLPEKMKIIKLARK